MLYAYDPSSRTIQLELGRTTLRIQESSARLASGLRIVTAADDPAGLLVSERLRSRLAALDGARGNIGRALDLVRTAGGALGEVTQLTVRLREIATQAANGTLSASDRAALQQEFLELAAEVRRVITGSTFDGVPLFTTVEPLRLQVGSEVGDEIQIPRIDLSTEASALLTLDVSRPSGARQAMVGIQTFQDRLLVLQGRIGGVDERLQSIGRSTDTLILNLAAAESRIRDVDVAAEASRLARDRILQEAGVALLAQANLHGDLVLRLFED